MPRGRELVKSDVWVREGRIIDPHHLFFKEKKSPDKVIECHNHILAPGFIDVQINGTAP